jgi:hypothetical protein
MVWAWDESWGFPGDYGCMADLAAGDGVFVLEHTPERAGDDPQGDNPPPQGPNRAWKTRQFGEIPRIAMGIGIKGRL